MISNHIQRPEFGGNTEIDQKIHLILNDLDHFGTNGADFGGLGVAGLLDLAGALAGETNAEN